MLTIIAIIIAAKKEHHGFAWFLGICEVLAVIGLLFAASVGELTSDDLPGLLSGGIPLIISLCLSDRKKRREAQQRQIIREELNRRSNEEKINQVYYSQNRTQGAGYIPTENRQTQTAAEGFICYECGYISAGYNAVCPRCGKSTRARRMTREEWQEYTQGTYQNPYEKRHQAQDKAYICMQCRYGDRQYYAICPSCGKATTMREMNAEELERFRIWEGQTTIPAEEAQQQPSPERPAKKFCSNCGERLSDNIRFCPYCGASLQD